MTYPHTWPGHRPVYHSPTHPLQPSPCQAQCVIGRYGYLQNSQRIFERHLERKYVYQLSGLGQFQLSTNPMGKTLMANSPPHPSFSPTWTPGMQDRAYH